MSSFTFAQLHLKTVHCGETVTPAGPNVELLDSVQLNETLGHDRKMWILVGTEEPACWTIITLISVKCLMEILNVFTL